MSERCVTVQEAQNDIRMIVSKSREDGGSHPAGSRRENTVREFAGREKQPALSTISV